MKKKYLLEFKEFVENVFIEHLNIEGLQMNFWTQFFEPNSNKLNSQVYERIKDKLFNLIHNLLLSKDKEQFFNACQKIISSKIFPFSYGNRNNILLWTNYGLQKDSIHGAMPNSLLLEEEYREYMSDGESPVFQFIWGLTKNLLKLIKNRRKLNFLGINNGLTDCLFFFNLFQQQREFEGQYLKGVFELIFKEIGKDKSFILEEPFHIINYFEGMYLKYSGMELFEEIAKIFIKDKVLLEYFLFDVSRAKTLTDLESNQKELFKTSFLNQKNESLAYNILLIYKSVSSNYSHIPYDKLLSELWVLSLSNNALRNIKIEFGQHTDNFGEEVNRSPRYSVPHINLDNIMASVELPVLLASLARTNLENIAKLNKISLKLKEIGFINQDFGEDEFQELFFEDKPRISLSGAVSSNPEEDYLVFSQPDKFSRQRFWPGSTIRVKLETLLENFEKETQKRQGNVGNKDEFKRMSLQESSSFLRTLILGHTISSDSSMGNQII